MENIKVNNNKETNDELTILPIHQNEGKYVDTIYLKDAMKLITYCMILCIGMFGVLNILNIHDAGTMIMRNIEIGMIPFMGLAMYKIVKHCLKGSF